MGKWSDIPVELVELIEDSLIMYADKVRVRAVCEYWYTHLPKINREFPWLLQAVDDNIDASHALFNPVDKKFYNLDVPNILQGKIWKGSSHGWVVTVEDTMCNSNKFNKDSNRIYLVNPITNARIELPSRDKFPDIMKYNPDEVDNEYTYFMSVERQNYTNCSSQQMNVSFTYKFVVSSDPSKSDGEDCVIAAIYNPCEYLACCTLKSKRWNHISADAEYSTFVDIMFHIGKLYALVSDGPAYRVLVFENINGVKPNPHFTILANYAPGLSQGIGRHSPTSFTITEDYLVECSDKSCILMVERFIKFTETNIKEVDTLQTCYFKVRKVDPINGDIIELKNIGDDVLFVGLNTSMSISSRACVGYRRNHIYFTDSKFIYERTYIKAEDSEIGAFNLEDGTIRPLSGLKSLPKFFWPPSIWAYQS